MLKSLFYYISDVVVSKRIKYVFAGFFIRYKIALAKHLQLMRYCGFGHAEKLGYIAHTKRSCVNSEENIYPRRISKDFKKVRKLVKRSFARHFCRPLFQLFAAVLMMRAGFYDIGIVMLHTPSKNFTVEWLFNRLNYTPSC